MSGIEYEAARAAAFMGYKIVCALEGLEVRPEAGTEIQMQMQIPRYTDAKYGGYLANMSPSEFARRFEAALPVTITGTDCGREGRKVELNAGVCVCGDSKSAIVLNTIQPYNILAINHMTILPYCCSTI